MSAHDFQAKFASVMESILQSAIAETTKLFEAMVEELKADMSTIKKDNDELKAKCSQFECAQKDGIAGNEPSKKRHSAVQCGEWMPAQTLVRIQSVLFSLNECFIFFS